MAKNNLYDKLSTKQLGEISSDFVKVADHLKEAAYIIRKKGGFSYPIFVMSRMPIDIGTVLISKGTVEKNTWFYNAAYLDYLIKKNIIAADRVELFKSIYKNPNEFCCLLIIDQSPLVNNEDISNNHSFFLKETGEIYSFLSIPYPDDIL